MPIRLRLGIRTVIRTLTISVLATAVAIVATQPASAQWRIAPSISAGLEYDDNPSLDIDSAFVSSVWGYGLDADARIYYESQLTDFSVTPKFLGTRYDGFSELDSDEWFVDLAYLYTGKLSRFRIRGSYADESIRRAERSDVDFEVEDPTEIPDDQSGRLLGSENRQRVHISPDWSYQIGQRSLFRVGVGYLDVTYDETSSVFLGDYRDTRGLASFEHELSPRNTITFGGYYRENEFESPISEYSGFGLTLGFLRSLTETARFVFNVGMDSTEDASGNEHTNPIGEISFVRRLQESMLLAAYRRTVSGSGSNVMSVRDTIDLLVSRNVSDKTSISAGVHAYRTSALDDTVVNFDERDYIQFRAMLTYNFSPKFSIDLDYRYTDIDREILMSDANSNLVNLWFRYHPGN